MSKLLQLSFSGIEPSGVTLQIVDIAGKLGWRPLVNPPGTDPNWFENDWFPNLQKCEAVCVVLSDKYMSRFTGALRKEAEAIMTAQRQGKTVYVLKLVGNSPDGRGQTTDLQEWLAGWAPGKTTNLEKWHDFLNDSQFYYLRLRSDHGLTERSARFRIHQHHDELGSRCIYISTNVSGGGLRAFSEPRSMHTNQDPARHAFYIKFLEKTSRGWLVEVHLQDGRNMYVSSNVYAGGHAVFGENIGSKSNTDPARRQFELVEEDPPTKDKLGSYTLTLRNGWRLYVSTNVKDSGHGVFAMPVGSATCNDSKRWTWRLEEM